MKGEQSMSDADFMSVGEHCQEPSCRQKDFLPFTCDCCQKTFCLEHRTYKAHSCPNAESSRETTIVCPLCARLISIAIGADPNEVFERHTRGDCEPSNYERVNKKPRCAAIGCKERLNLSNSHVCKHCSAKVCLKHRFPEDHKCTRAKRGVEVGIATSRSKLGQYLSLGSMLPSLFKGGSDAEKQPASSSRTGNIGPKSPPQSQHHSIVRAQGAAQGARKAQRNGSGASRDEEECSVCHRRFPDVASLIDHSQDHYSCSASCSAFQDLCPHCQKEFPSAVALVEHVERQHTDHKGCIVC